MLSDQFPDMIKNGTLDDRRSILVVNNRNGDAPDTLPRNAPIGSIPNHVYHFGFAPSWIPFDGVNGRKEVLTDWINGTEPLRGGAENDRFLRSPIVRITMDDVDFFQ